MICHFTGVCTDSTVRAVRQCRCLLGQKETTSQDYWQADRQIRLARQENPQKQLKEGNSSADNRHQR